MQLRNYMSAKIHNATVTRSDLHYVGSITIDKQLLEITGMQKNERVLVVTTHQGLGLKPTLLKASMPAAV